MIDSHRPTPAGLAMLWILFFLISAGLGYPTLRRYDPRNPRTNFDGATRLYYWQVTGGTPENTIGPSTVHYRYRLLVPLVARPFYVLGKGHVGTWDAGYFALLASNAIFCASTALLLFALAQRALGEVAPALVAALLYLLSFAVPNFLLAGLVDSGEAFALMALAWILERGRWWWLAFLGAIGALAKETFVLFSVAFVIGWGAAVWLEDRRGQSSDEDERRWRVAEWVGGATLVGLAGLAVLTAVFSLANGHLVWPWQFERSGVDFDDGLWQRVTRFSGDVTLLYVFGWLVPFGAPGLPHCPRRWVAGALLGVAAAVALGTFNAEPGLARSLFNILGPLLCLGSAVSITRVLSTRR